MQSLEGLGSSGQDPEALQANSLNPTQLGVSRLSAVTKKPPPPPPSQHEPRDRAQVSEVQRYGCSSEDFLSARESRSRALLQKTGTGSEKSGRSLRAICM